MTEFTFLEHSHQGSQNFQHLPSQNTIFQLLTPHFIIHHTSKILFFFSTSFNFFFFYSLYVSFSLLSLSSYLCLSLSLKPHHFLCKPTPTASCCQPPPSKTERKIKPLANATIATIIVTVTTTHKLITIHHRQPEKEKEKQPSKITTSSPSIIEKRKRKRKTTHQNHKPKPTTLSPPTIGKGKRKTTTKREQKHNNAITYGLIHTCE